MMAFVEHGGLMIPAPIRSNGNDRIASDNMMLLQERIAELELSLEDQGWQSVLASSGFEFSQDHLLRIVRLCRLNYLKNPLVRRAVDVRSHYVWGQGFTVKANDEEVNRVIHGFLDDPINRNALTGHAARMRNSVAMQTDGNMFLALFVNQGDGQVTIGRIAPEEVDQIVTNPENRDEPWMYHRTWGQLSVETKEIDNRQALYPDYRYRPAAMPTIMGTVKVENVPVMHLKSGGLNDMLFGVPDVYVALDWVRAYKESLEDDATRSRALARYAWNLTTKGGSGGVAAAKSKLGTTFGSGGGGETNPPPVTGSTFIGSEGVKLDPVRLAGAVLPTDHNRAIRLMVASAFGLPETFFGDANVGNHATAKTLDRPTELQMLDRQRFWHEVYSDLFDFVIEQSMTASAGRLSSVVVKDEYGQLTVEDAESGERVALKIDIDFPPILSHERDTEVTAIVNAATLGGHTARGTIPDTELSKMLLSALGTDDIDEILAQMKAIDGDSSLSPNGDGDGEQATGEADLPSPDLELLSVAAELRKLTEALK